MGGMEEYRAYLGGIQCGDVIYICLLDRDESFMVRDM